VSRPLSAAVFSTIKAISSLVLDLLRFPASAPEPPAAKAGISKPSTPGPKPLCSAIELAPTVRLDNPLEGGAGDFPSSGVCSAPASSVGFGAARVAGVCSKVGLSGFWTPVPLLRGSGGRACSVWCGEEGSEGAAVAVGEAGCSCEEAAAALWEAALLMGCISVEPSSRVSLGFWVCFDETLGLRLLLFRDQKPLFGLAPCSPECELVGVPAVEGGVEVFKARVLPSQNLHSMARVLLPFQNSHSMVQRGVSSRSSNLCRNLPLLKEPTPGQ